eukprot:5638059-Amphidinium_carterae.2
MHKWILSGQTLKSLDVTCHFWALGVCIQIGSAAKLSETFFCRFSWSGGKATFLAQFLSKYVVSSGVTMTDNLVVPVWHAHQHAYQWK